MSLSAPSALGTLLLSPLDAALGITPSQQTHLATDARLTAISQARRSERATPVNDTAQQQTAQQGILTRTGNRRIAGMVVGAGSANRK